jgi:UDP:flavonoid glycosyltransferase YjiC (YdhE family)
VRPDVVVGDYRFTLSTSAALAGVRCATLANAFNSPYSVRGELPIPDLPVVDAIGVERFKRYFPDGMKQGLREHTAPLNAVRREHDLPPLPHFWQLIVDGDLTLYAEVPELCPTRDLPAHHHYIGHVGWAPAVELSPELLSAPAGESFVYVTLGSTGRVSALPVVIEALGRLPLRALVATADRVPPGELPANVRAVSYVPGHLAARAARLVITNGGASTSYQALVEGRPVLGVASNLDQYLCMTAIEQASAGILLRAGSISVEQVTAAVLKLLESVELRAGAAAVAAAFARLDCHQRFAEILDRTPCAKSA